MTAVLGWIANSFNCFFSPLALYSSGIGRAQMKKQIRLIEKKIDTQHVITSPDVPGLYVAHADLETTRCEVEPTLAMLTQMLERRGKLILRAN
jgi:hypothetical protein